MLTEFEGRLYHDGRKAAKAAGAKYYFTGWKCPHGHSSLRWTTTGSCIACRIPGIPGQPYQAQKNLEAAYIPVPCLCCGTLMPYSHRKRECCSHKCANTVQHHLRGGLSKTKVCGHCQAEFTAKPAELYCSALCKRAAKILLHSTPRAYLKRLLLIRKRNETISIDFLIAMLQAQKNQCAITGRQMTFHAGEGYVATNASIDRIDSSQGYEVGNVQLVCVAVNMMKKDAPQGDFVQWCRDVVQAADQRGVDHAVHFAQAA